MVWNEEVTQKDVSAIAQEARAWRIAGRQRRDAPLATDTLVSGYKEYEKEYDRNFGAWVAGRLQLEDLAQEAVSQAAAVQPASIRRWSAELLRTLPALVAKVFCFFTVANSGESYTRLMQNKDTLWCGGSDDDGAMKIDNVLLKPHPTQVLTVLQMLGYGGKPGQLERQLMQIRTGEGKSLVLGACSVVLGLLGFRVRCVCYSQYLSQRDKALFADLFDAFRVRRLVTYSTISDYAGHSILRKGAICALSEALLRGETKPAAAHSQANSRATPRPESFQSSVGGFDDESMAVSESKTGNTANGVVREPEEILLVDEVDIFFGEDFYGKTYNPAVKLPEAAGLLRTVWRLRHSAGNRLLSDIKQSPEFRTILQSFPGWDEVIEREVQAMCADVLCFDDPKPHYDRGLDKLGYKVMDGISFDIHYGYRTAFA
eukprot:2544070-Rhodomonas_salina.4